MVIGNANVVWWIVQRMYFDMCIMFCMSICGPKGRIIVAVWAHENKEWREEVLGVHVLVPDKLS